MAEIRTDEWYDVAECMPPRGREVIVRFADGHKEFLVWDGFHWNDRFGIRQMYYGRCLRPAAWYMFEKHPDDYGK